MSNVKSRVKDSFALPQASQCTVIQNLCRAASSPLKLIELDPKAYDQTHSSVLVTMHFNLDTRAVLPFGYRDLRISRTVRRNYIAKDRYQVYSAGTGSTGDATGYIISKGHIT